MDIFESINIKEYFIFVILFVKEAAENEIIKNYSLYNRPLKFHHLGRKRRTGYNLIFVKEYKEFVLSLKRSDDLIKIIMKRK